MHGISLSGSFGPDFRHSIERMGAVEYLTTSYYEHWLHSIVDRGVRNGHFSDAELAVWERRIAAGEQPPRVDDPQAVERVRGWFRPRPVERFEGPPARHRPGDRVRVIQLLPAGHTRCPGYLRGAVGVVESVHPPLPLLDVYENENGRLRPEPWYTVAFEASDLWRLDGPGHQVLVDLWESHIEEWPA